MYKKGVLREGGNGKEVILIIFFKGWLVVKEDFIVF